MDLSKGGMATIFIREEGQDASSSEWLLDGPIGEYSAPVVYSFELKEDSPTSFIVHVRIEYIK